MALVGVVAVLFVMRHKSVEKRSMYSARRSQIEHKVRAARQRTLEPHGRSEKPAEAEAAQPAGTSSFSPSTTAPSVTYEPSAYEPPPAAPPPGVRPPPEAAPPQTWGVGPTAPAPSPFAAPPSAPEPAYAPPEKQQDWTPAPASAEPAAHAEPVQPAAPAAGGASWSIVGDSRGSAEAAEPGSKQKPKEAVASGSWQLASGEAPGAETGEEVKRPSAAIAIAQYAVLVVGLVMVLIGVLVMVANSHVT